MLPTSNVLTWLSQSAKPSWWRVVSTPNFMWAATAASAHWFGSSAVGLNCVMSRFGVAQVPVYVRIPKWRNIPKRSSLNARWRSSSGVPTAVPPEPPGPPPLVPAAPLAPPPAAPVGEREAPDEQPPMHPADRTQIATDERESEANRRGVNMAKV